ncbi:MAG: transporter substrate-binding protein, partial [Chloroflexaceae bacterium]|nr:transporter substrate-binding protein [Chloroflexaceae bacterium]
MTKAPTIAALDCGIVPVGILHSLSSTIAVSESPLVEATLMAIAEINQAGGVLGRQIKAIVENGASNPDLCAEKTRKLAEKDVRTIFGAWTSAARKAVLPLLEAFDILLWYPVEYEGLECSPQIFYTGTCPNQQVAPAVNWLLQQQKRRFFLLGSDYVFPRTANKLIRALLKQRGAQVAGEVYVDLGFADFAGIVAQIQRSQADVVFSTLNGDSNRAFYQQYGGAG